MTELDLIYRHR